RSVPVCEPSGEPSNCTWKVVELPCARGDVVGCERRVNGPVLVTPEMVRLVVAAGSLAKVKVLTTGSPSAVLPKSTVPPLLTGLPADVTFRIGEVGAAWQVADRL